MSTARQDPAAALLPDGDVLVTGGSAPNGGRRSFGGTNATFTVTG
jgi:hypothetical protein